MRRWRELAPYNAGQIMTLSGAPDFVRLASVAQKVVSQTGLGTPVFSDRDAFVHFDSGAPTEVASAQGSLEAVVTAEMNRPFGPKDLPVRFYVLPDHGKFYFGVTYDHWVSDSRAIRNLMQRIYAAYCGLPDLEPLLLPQQNFDALFGHHQQLRAPLARLRASVINYIRHRRAFRINLSEPLNFTSKTRILALEPGLIKKIHAHAKSRGASVNDAFLAALGRGMGQYTAAARKIRRNKLFHGQRNRVALGTIADIRELSATPLENIFGLYLSSYSTVLKAPEKESSDTVLARITRSTHKLKENHGVMKSYLGLQTTLFWWDFYKHAKDKARLFQKNVPVVAGISNVNMTRHWVDMPSAPEKGPQVLDYLRISPTGPLLPLVFTLTTIDQRLSLCVTYRTTALNDEQAQKIIDGFIQELNTLAV